MDWKILREMKAAEEAERIAASSGGDYGATGDFDSTPVDDWKPFVPLGSAPSDSSSFSTPGAIASPREAAATSFGEQQEPGLASQYMSQLGSNLGKAADATGVTKLGTEALGVASDIGESAGTLYRYPSRVVGNAMAGESPFKASEFKGALSDLASPLRRLAHWNNPMMVPEPKSGQGLSGQTLSESIEAMAGPFENEDGKLRLKPDVSGWDAARMVGGGLAGVGSEILSMPGGVLPKVPNPAEALGSLAARGAAKVGLPNPTMSQLASGLGNAAQELLGVARATPPEGNLFEEAVRRGAVNMPGKPQLTKEQSDKITAVATQLATVNGKLNPEKLSDYWTAGALRAREIDTLDEAALAHVMRDFSMKEARANRTGVPLKAEMVAAREQIPIDEADSLGLSDEATKEILAGGPMEAEAPAKVRTETYAPRGESAEAATARLSRVEKAIADGGDVEQVMQDAAMLPRDAVFDLALELGGNAQRNKQKGLDIIREALEQRAKEPSRPPTSAAGRQEAAELELAEQAEAIAENPTPAAPAPAGVSPATLSPEATPPRAASPGQPPSERPPSPQATSPSKTGQSESTSSVPREPTAITIPQSNIDYRGPYGNVLDDVKSLVMTKDKNGSNHPAMRELVARGLRAESETAKEIGPLLEKAAKADEAVRASGWNPFNIFTRKPKHVAPLVERHPSIKNPDFEYNGLTLAIDADAQAGAGLAGPLKFKDPVAQNYADVMVEGYHKTGQMAEDVGTMIKDGMGGEVPFQRNVGGKMNATPNMQVPWMGKPGDKTFRDWLSDMIEINPNAKIDLKQYTETLSQIRSNPDKAAAYESLRQFDDFPDWWKDRSGKWWPVNGASINALPVGRGGLTPKIWKEAFRAKWIDEVGQPEMETGFNYLHNPSTPDSGLLYRIADEGGDQAVEKANKLVAALNGNRNLAGKYSVAPLSHESHWGSAGKEWLNVARGGAVSMAGFKQLAQTPMETAHLFPGYLGPVKGAAVTTFETGKQAINYVAHQLDRRLGELIDKAPVERLAGAGVVHHDQAAENIRWWQNLTKQVGGEPIPNRPQTTLGKMWAGLADYVATPAAKIINNMLVKPFSAVTEATGTINHAGASALDKYLGGDFASKALRGKLREIDLITMERQGINGEIVELVRDLNKEAAAGGHVIAPAGLKKDIAGEWARVLPHETQYMGSPAYRTPEISNDSIAKNVLMFLRFSTGTGRKSFEYFQDISTILRNADMSMLGKNGKLDNLTYLTWRHFARAHGPGTQLSGELQRAVANRLYDREDTDLEKWGSGYGRMVQNMLLGQFFGPLWMLADYGMSKANVKRPYATRGGKEEKARGIADSLFIPQAIDKAVEAVAPGVVAPAVAAGILEKKPGHQDDSAFGGVGKAVMSYGGPRQVGSALGLTEPQSGSRTRSIMPAGSKGSRSILGGGTKGSRSILGGSKSGSRSILK